MKKSTFEMSYQFSDMLHEKNLEAVAHSNGVLNELVQHSAPVGITTANSLSQTDEDYLSVYSGNFLDGTTQDYSAYPAAINTLVDQIAPLVTAHVSHARNVVKPLVVSFAESYLEYMESAKIKDPGSMFEICKCSLPSILTDESFISELGWGKDTAPKMPSEFLRIPEGKMQADLIEMMLVGSARVDEQIKTWVASKDANWIETIWYSVFGQQEYLPQNVHHSGYTGCEYGFTAVEAAEYSLAVYLLARKIQMNIPEGLQMSLAKFDTLVTSIKDYAVSQLVKNLQKVASANSSKSLVLYYDEYNYRLYVNGDLYGQWLDAGNTPELLLGMISSGGVVKTIPEIDERADKFKRAWDNFCSLHNAKEINNRHIYAKQALVTLFHQHLKHEVPEEKEVRQKESNFMDTRLKKAEAFINEMTTTQLDDVFNVALHLVARIRFDYTSAFYILRDIDAVCKVNPEIDPREAATLATINYVGDYLADQIAVRFL